MKAVKKASLGVALLGLLCIAAVWIYETHDDAFTDEGLVQADAPDLKHTVVSPHWEAPIADGENVLWCGTFQLAWNEACSLVGEDLRFENEPAMVELLNQKSFTKEDIDADSYIAVAGFVKDDVFGQISRQLEKTFHGQATPHYAPTKKPTSNPQDLVVYSYLFKNLEFPVPFERIEEPLVFGKERVACFGIGRERKEEHSKMREQLNLLYYQSENDFVIELKTTSERDRLILAKMQPEPTLGATVEAVEKHVARNTRIRPRSGDVLMVPKLNFDLTRHFDDLEERTLLIKSPDGTSGLVVTTALQNVRFQLDEEGARLRSEALIEGDTAAPGWSPPKKRVMIFDKPFLLLLQRTESEVPYFALWVGEPELLVKAEK